MTEQERVLRDELRLKTDGEGRRNYAVTAGAGAGKTTMLSHRVCQQLCEGIPVEAFAVITYTDAAASELREKITSRLRAAADDDAASPESRTHAENALSRIERMQISTIHSFLLKILRENAFASGVAPGATLLKEQDDMQRKVDFFQRWYRRHPGEVERFQTNWLVTDEKAKVIRALQDLFCDLANVRETVVYDTSDPAPMLERAADEYNAFWMPKLPRFKEVFEANRPRKNTGELIRLNKGGAAMINALAAAEVHDGIARAEDISTVLQKVSERLNGKLDSLYPKKRGADNLDDDLDAIEELEFPAKAPAREWSFAERERLAFDAQKASQTVEFFLPLQREYQALIDSETQQLSNDDILYRADKLLQEHPEVLRKLQETYTKIYVDEFQDTTRLQTSIIRKLAGADGAPENCPFADNRLMLVGDPKQSIYRFTGAEKSIFDNIITEMDQMPNARAATLHANFRSNSTIVDWLNEHYRSVMGEAYTDMDTDWVPQDPDALHGVFRFSLSDETPDNPTAVAELIRTLTNDDRFYLEEYRHDAPEGRQYLRRKIRYSDFLVITGQAKNVTAPFVEAFAAANVPVSVQGKFEVIDDGILRSFVTLVRWLANPKDTVLRHAALKFTAGKDPTQLSADAYAAELSALDDLLSRLSGEGRDMAAIVRRLLNEETLFIPKREEPYSSQELRMHRTRLHQMVEACLADCSGDLYDLAARMEEYLVSSVSKEIPPESEINAVRLMNVHKSKGLTANIVIIADRSTGFKENLGSFKKDGFYYPSVITGFGAGKKFFPAYGADRDLINYAVQEEQREMQRLEYVAATRAAHALIFSPHEDGTWFSAEEYSIPSLEDIADWMDARRPADLPEEELQARRGEVLTLRDLQENLAARQEPSLPVFSLMPSGLEREGKSGFTPQEPGYEAENRPSGNVFGTALHRVFELAVLLPGTDPAQLVRMAIDEQKEALHRSDDPDAIEAFLLQKVPAYLREVLTPALADAEEILPEFSFSFYVPPEERADFDAKILLYLKEADRAAAQTAERILVNGQADLVVRYRDGSIRVFDYKSDCRDGKPVDAFEAAAYYKYEGQLALYRYAVGKCFGVAPDDITTVLFHMYRI